jgi:S-adenosylmethionine:tRNA-ribosyltransferase-isomerase (queuine synthetase)
MKKWGERIFSYRQFGMRVYIRVVKTVVRILNFATSRNLVVKLGYSRTEIFISTPGLLMMGRLTTRLITC